MQTRNELSDRFARLTLVRATGMPSAKDCLGNKLHGYCSFVVNHDLLPRIPLHSVITLQHVLTVIPVDIWVGDGSLVFLLLGWAIASGTLPGGLAALSERMQHGLRAGDSNEIEVFEAAVTHWLTSVTWLGAGGGVGFDCDGLRSSLKSFLKDVRPENLAFLLGVALPWMTASQNSRLSRDDGHTLWPRWNQSVHGYFELISGRLGSRTAVIRLHIPSAKSSLWASWQHADPGFFNGQVLHGTFVVAGRNYSISGVVMQVSRVKAWQGATDQMRHAAVNALTLLAQLQPEKACDPDANILQEVVGFEWNHFSLTHYYKQNTRIVAEPRYKLLMLEASLLRHVFGTDLVQRPAGDHAEHPKFAKAAAMGLCWFQAYRRVMTDYQQVALQVSCNVFCDLQDLVLGPRADPVLVAVWSPLSRLGFAFASKFWKFLLQPNSTLLLGLTCILSHWTLGYCFRTCMFRTLWNHVPIRIVL